MERVIVYALEPRFFLTVGISGLVATIFFTVMFIRFFLNSRDLLKNKEIGLFLVVVILFSSLHILTEYLAFIGIFLAASLQKWIFHFSFFALLTKTIFIGLMAIFFGYLGRK